MFERVPITGKVAAILSPRELAINRGSDDGVQKGMKFAVLDASVREIRDPDTDEVLGSLKREKVRVEVIEVEEKFSVAHTFERSGSSSPGLAGVAAMFQAAAASSGSARTKTLRRADSSWERLDEKDSYVGVGDPVEEIIEDVDEIVESDVEAGQASSHMKEKSAPSDAGPRGNVA